MAAARRKRHEDHEEHENHERWLITYADMITLLMVLFIVLFAMANVDLKKFDKLKAGLGTAFGGSPQPVLEGGDGVMDGASQPAVPVVEAAQRALEEKERQEKALKADFDALESAKDEIARDLAAHGVGDKVRFRHETRGLVVTVVTDQVLFDPGAAALRPEGRTVLDGLAGALARLPNHVAVEGHTDDRPISSAVFPSNWELSTARATSVLRYLIDAHHLAVSRSSAAGYADQRPVAANLDEAGRTANRRVEIVVLSQHAESQQALSQQAPSQQAPSQQAPAAPAQSALNPLVLPADPLPDGKDAAPGGDSSAPGPEEHPKADNHH